jgi:hypothetical protein
MRRSAALPILCLLSALPGLAAPSGHGAGELSLDRAAVAGLLRSALEEPLEREVPGVGRVTLRIQPPRSVGFVDGGIEARVEVAVEPPGLTAALDLRYVPAVEPLHGVVLLEPRSAIPDAPLPLPLDLGAWLPPVRLPRMMDWELPLEDGRDAGALAVTCYVHDLTIDEDRLTVSFGLVLGGTEKGRVGGALLE